MSVMRFNTDDILMVLAIVQGIFLIAIGFLFFVHRRNIRQKIAHLEERHPDYFVQAEPKVKEEPDAFKKALQLHLNEISERIRSNEQLTNKLINQLDALRDALTEGHETTAAQAEPEGVVQAPDCIETAPESFSKE